MNKFFIAYIVIFEVPGISSLILMEMVIDMVQVAERDNEACISVLPLIGLQELDFFVKDF
jgi:hypothetical protein